MPKLDQMLEFERWIGILIGLSIVIIASWLHSPKLENSELQKRYKTAILILGPATILGLVLMDATGIF